MKSINLLFFCLFFTIALFAQKSNLPKQDIRDINGNWVSTESVFKGSAPSIIYFANITNAKYCDQIQILNELWKNSYQDKGIRLILICTDNNGKWSNIKPFISAKNLDCEIYIDQNNSLKRIMEVNQLPASFLDDKIHHVLYRCVGIHSDHEMLFIDELEKIIKSTRKDTLPEFQKDQYESFEQIPL